MSGFHYAVQVSYLKGNFSTYQRQNAPLIIALNVFYWKSANLIIFLTVVYSLMQHDLSCVCFESKLLEFPSFGSEIPKLYVSDCYLHWYPLWCLGNENALPNCFGGGTWEGWLLAIMMKFPAVLSKLF